MDQHKISIRVILEDYEKFILNDVVIKAGSDMRLKIRSDLSIENLGPADVDEIRKQKKLKLDEEADSHF